jgi:hypothetical protein
MKLKSRDRHIGSFDPELNSVEETEWPAVVRRLAVKVQPGREPQSRKTKAARRSDDEQQLQRIARVKSWGMPY